MTVSSVDVRPATLTDPQVRRLLETHARRALANARCRQGHALTLDDLEAESIELWSLWEGETAVAVGALRRLDAEHGELKSMFVDDTHRGQGLGHQLLTALIDRAGHSGLSRLSLETGAAAYFNAARALYAAHGFAICEAFADLPPHPDSVFMTRVL
ncbi:MAG: GNAT family N-acetyltransferase [Pseudomonadota bacterium]